VPLRWRRSAAATRKHLCFAARPIATIEHLQALAHQAAAAGFEVCWLDLGDDPAIDSFILDHGSPDAAPARVHDARALRAHLRAHRPAGIWIQSPYAEHYPPWFWDVAEPAGLCFAGYAVTLTTWDHGHYGLDTYRRCAWVLTENGDERDRFLDHGVDAERVVVAGNAVLHDLRVLASEPASPSVDLLWAPHWLDDWFGEPGFARWRETAPTLLAYALKNPGVEIVVRPHPFLPRIVAAEDGSAAASAYRDLLELSHVRLSDVSMVDDVTRSRALLTDSLSLIVYFSQTGRPLGVVRNDGSPRLNAAGRALLEVSDVLPDQAAVEGWLAGLSTATTDERRPATVAELYPDPGRSPIEVWWEAAQEGSTARR
jgi:hypothetical protein